MPNDNPPPRKWHGLDAESEALRVMRDEPLPDLNVTIPAEEVAAYLEWLRENPPLRLVCQNTLRMSGRSR